MALRAGRLKHQIEHGCPRVVPQPDPDSLGDIMGESNTPPLFCAHHLAAPTVALHDLNRKPRRAVVPYKGYLARIQVDLGSYDASGQMSPDDCSTRFDLGILQNGRRAMRLRSRAGRIPPSPT